MKELHLKLYSFDELSEDAKQKVIEKRRSEVQDHAMEVNSYDYRKTLSEFEKLFDISVSAESIECSARYNFRFKNDYVYEWDYDYEGITQDEVTNKLLIRYLNNNILPHIYTYKIYYGKYKYDESGNFIGSKTRKSRIIEYCDCPLTGCCYDFSIINPIILYMQKPTKDFSLKELVDECLWRFFKSWQEEYEYCESDEFVGEELEENSRYEDDLYFEDGTLYDGPIPEKIPA